MSPSPLHSRYTILRKIADGGTAEVFLAKQTGASGFEKMVVLKRIFNTFYSDPQFRHMLIDEAHIAMSLYHSNIVQVLDLDDVAVVEAHRDVGLVDQHVAKLRIRVEGVEDPLQNDHLLEAGRPLGR